MTEFSRLRIPSETELSEAVEVVSKTLRPTPLLPAILPTPEGPLDCLLKLETWQPTGAFKVRGALAALASLSSEQTAVSASAGNHAQGMVWAANRLGRPTIVVTAENASAVKVERIRDMCSEPGSQVRLIQHGHSYDEAEAEALRICQQDPGTEYVSAYSDYAVIAGAASLGHELSGALGPTEELTLAVPVGGGGLCSGLSLWAQSRGNTHILATEAAANPAASVSARAGSPTDAQLKPTIADGLAGNLDQSWVTPSILDGAERSGVLGWAQVTEEEIRQAIRFAFANLGLVLEGAGAAGLAAVLAGKGGAGEGRPVVICSGRNITPQSFAQILA